MPLNGPKRSVTNIKRGTLEFYVDAFTIAACKSNGQYNIAMLVRLANNTNDTIAVPSSKQAIFNDGIGTFPSYIEGTLYGQKVRFRQMGGDEQIPPHGDIMLELFLDNFRPVPQSIYMIEDVICCDSIRSMSLDYVYKPSESDKLNTCRYIHFNAMQNAAFAVAPSDLAFLHITQNLRAIPELFEGSANHEGQANIMCERVIGVVRIMACLIVMWERSLFLHKNNMDVIIWLCLQSYGTIQLTRFGCLCAKMRYIKRR